MLKIREGQEDQLCALGLVLNAIILWNTIYMDAALDQLRGEGFDSATRTWRVCHRSVTSTSTCSAVTPSPGPSRWSVVNCDHSAARPSCLMMLESGFCSAAIQTPTTRGYWKLASWPGCSPIRPPRQCRRRLLL